MELLSSDGDTFLIDIFLHDDARVEGHLFCCFDVVSSQNSYINFTIIIYNSWATSIFEQSNGFSNLIPEVVSHSKSAEMCHIFFNLFS